MTTDLTAAVAESNETTFEYKQISVKDMNVLSGEAVKSNGGKRVIEGVIIEDEVLQPTTRFWESLQARFGISGSIFKYFSYDEVFNRISAKSGDKDEIRVCVERVNDKAQLLGVSAPNRPVVRYDEAADICNRFGSENFVYSNGMIESRHVPRVKSPFQIGGDDFDTRFMMSIPVDGYGAPSVYLGLLRMVCSNGLIAYTKAFRQDVSLGKGGDDTSAALIRTLDAFNNDEGYAALRSRLDASAKSIASVNEAVQVYKLLVAMHARHELRDDTSVENSQVLNRFHELTGDINELYGIANIDAISQKKQRILPVKCTVYQLMNFITEISTHYTKPNGIRKMNAWVGSILQNEYDMEGTASGGNDFEDLYFTAKLSANLTGSGHSAA